MNQQRPSLELKKNLQDKYVAYIDVLGFKNLVSGGSVKELESYFTKILEVLDKLRAEKSRIESFLISDAIILISPQDPQGLRDIILATRRIQSALLWQKILLRGAISYGQVFYDKMNNIIVGQGFVKAYLLEQEAVHPRVLLDPSIIKQVADDRKAFVNLIQKTAGNEFDDRLIYKKSGFSKISDDCIFVDYANKSVLQMSINNNISKVYDLIHSHLYGDQKLYSKYVWLRDYFLEWLEVTNLNLEASYKMAELMKSKVSPATLKQHRDIRIWLDKFSRL